MFRRHHDRWIEELDVQLRYDRAITSSGAVLTVPAAATDLREWISSTRKYLPVQYSDWQQVISDFKGSVKMAGPRLLEVTEPATAQIQTELSRLFVPTSVPDLFDIDLVVRGAIRSLLEVLELKMSSSESLIACWGDLVAICRQVNRSPDDVSLRRDTLWAVAELRHLDLTGQGRILGHIASLMVDNPNAVHEELDLAAGVPHTPRSLTSEPTGIGVAQRLDLCETALSRQPERAHCIVWLRLAPATLPRYEAGHGQVTFYNAAYLSSVIRDPRRSHELFTVLPSEVLFPQESPPILMDGEDLWENDNCLVYARVVLPNAVIHDSISTARALVEALTSVNHPTPGTWKLLNGALVFIDGQSASLLGWGPKEYDVDDMYYAQNDWMDRDIELMSRHGRALNSDMMHDLRDALNMSQALKAATGESPQAVVMTAVRAIEHVNVWTTGGVKDWADFAGHHLKKGHSRVWFVQSIGQAMLAAIHYGSHPSLSVDARREMQLIEGSLGSYDKLGHKSFHVRGFVDHVGRVAQLYDKHWLARNLGDVATALENPHGRRSRLEELGGRFDLQLRRLKRLRNAAIHGGPTSNDVCQSIATFASAVAHRSLNESMRALLSGRQIEQHMNDYRIQEKERWEDVCMRGEIEALFAQSED